MSINDSPLFYALLENQFNTLHSLLNVLNFYEHAITLLIPKYEQISRIQKLLAESCNENSRVSRNSSSIRARTYLITHILKKLENYKNNRSSLNDHGLIICCSMNKILPKSTTLSPNSTAAQIPTQNNTEIHSLNSSSSTPSPLPALSHDYFIESCVPVTKILFVLDFRFHIKDVFLSCQQEIARITLNIMISSDVLIQDLYSTIISYIYDQ